MLSFNLVRGKLLRTFSALVPINSPSKFNHRRQKETRLYQVRQMKPRDRMNFIYDPPKRKRLRVDPPMDGAFP